MMEMMPTAAAAGQARRKAPQFRGQAVLASLQPIAARGSNTELSMGWVDPWVGLGWNGLGWFGLGWVNYSKGTKNLKGLR